MLNTSSKFPWAEAQDSIEHRLIARLAPTPERLAEWYQTTASNHGFVSSVCFLSSFLLTSICEKWGAHPSVAEPRTYATIGTKLSVCEAEP